MVGARLVRHGMVQWSRSMFANLVIRIPILYWWWCFNPKGDNYSCFPRVLLFRLSVYVVAPFRCERLHCSAVGVPF